MDGETLVIFTSMVGDFGCLSLGISLPCGDNGYELLFYFGDRGRVRGRNEMGEGGTGDLRMGAGFI